MPISVSENDNLRDEYSSLYSDVETDIPWARIALGQSPDAINLWIGNSNSVTALHRDNYENIYCQIVGSVCRFRILLRIFDMFFQFISAFDGEFKLVAQ